LVTNAVAQEDLKASLKGWRSALRTWTTLRRVMEAMLILDLAQIGMW
jgi:hypothetical protein